MARQEDTFVISCRKCGSLNRIPAAKEGIRGRCGNCGETLPPLYHHPIPLADGTFDQFVRAYEQPVLAEFWAPW